MNEYKQVIEIFKMENELMKFNPSTGEKEPIELQNEDNQDLYKANLVAIEVLEKQLNNGWIPTSERLPQLPDGKSFMPLNATILAPSGLRNTVQMTWELKRGKPTWCYLGVTSDWNVIAWQPLPESWEGEEE